jgi:hypothetical protein
MTQAADAVPGSPRTFLALTYAMLNDKLNSAAVRWGWSDTRRSDTIIIDNVSYARAQAARRAQRVAFASRTPAATVVCDAMSS